MASIIPTPNVSYGFAPTGTFRPSPFAMPSGIESGKTIESILARERSHIMPVPIERIPTMPIEPTMMPTMPMPVAMPMPLPAPIERMPVMIPRIPTLPIEMPIPQPWMAPMPWSSPMPWTAPVSPAVWPLSWTPSPVPAWTPMPWWRPEQQPEHPLNAVPFRPANHIEMASLERPVRIVDREGRREVRVIVDLTGYKPEEITVTLNKAERAIVIEASVEAKEGKEHQVSRKYSRKVVLPESLAKVDIASVGPLSAAQRPDGMLIVELPVPKMTSEEIARLPADVYLANPEAVRPVTVKSL